MDFVGDVSLSRGVADEIARRGSPWAGERSGRPAIGNLEGALDAGEPCPPAPAICLRIPAPALEALRSSPFVALSTANNHAGDQGDAGRVATEEALERLGIAAVGDDAPRFVRVGQRWLGLVAVDLADGTPHRLRLAAERARLEIGLARASTPLVAVLPHWGREYDREPTPYQEDLAERFAAWGASMVMGAHAHVRQAARCGRAATWFGLGDHLFDQGPDTFVGERVTCCAGAGLTCAGGLTERTARSTFPRPAGADGVECSVPLDADPDTSWWAHPWASRFAFVQAMPALGPHAFFALHRGWSDLDRVEALRPYVFRMDGRRSVDLWRGTALERPLVAARLAGDGPILCALLRDDSFADPRPDTDGRRWTAWRWSGFGFRRVDEVSACDGL